MVPEILTVGLAVSMVAGLIMSTLHPDTDGFAFWRRLFSRVSLNIRIADKDASDAQRTDVES